MTTVEEAIAKCVSKLPSEKCKLQPKFLCKDIPKGVFGKDNYVCYRAEEKGVK